METYAGYRVAVRVKRRKTFIGKWAVVDDDGTPLLRDASGEPRLFAVPELAVVAGNELRHPNGWSVRWLA